MNTAPEAPPKARLPLLRSWYTKVAYVLVAIAVYYVVGGLAPTDNSRGILRAALVLALFLLATRVFRGANEAGNEARPWWRMTGRPFAGWVFGALFALAGIGSLVAAFAFELPSGSALDRAQEPVVVVVAIMCALLAVLYLTSSIRLRRTDRVAPVSARAKED